MSAILVSAFPGLGKTYLYQQYKDRLKILDLNTGRFEGDDFPGNYIAEVEKRLNDYDLILLSSEFVQRTLPIISILTIKITFTNISDHFVVGFLTNRLTHHH